jgi:hypothetical protein
MARALVVAACLSGCLASVPPPPPPGSCVHRGRHAAYSADGRPIDSATLERLVQPDARGRAGFRTQRAGSTMFILGLSLFAAAWTVLVVSASVEHWDGGIPFGSKVAGATIGVAGGLGWGLSIPVSAVGDSEVRAAVADYNTRNHCP